MKKILALILLTTAIAHGQTAILLEDFNFPSNYGSVLSSTSWVNNVSFTNGNTTVTLGANAKDDNGWGRSGLTLNASAMNYVAITAQRDATISGTSFQISFVDQNFHSVVYSTSTSSFAIGSLTTVYLPISSWGTVNPSQISFWSIGGGDSGGGTLPYQMTFDNLALVSAIPEPATNAAIAGGLALGLAWWRRKPRKNIAAS